MHDDGREGRSLVGSALVNESIQGKSRSSSRRQSQPRKSALPGLIQMALMLQNAKCKMRRCCDLSEVRPSLLSTSFTEKAQDVPIASKSNLGDWSNLRRQFLIANGSVSSKTTVVHFRLLTLASSGPSVLIISIPAFFISFVAAPHPCSPAFTLLVASRTT